MKNRGFHLRIKSDLYVIFKQIFKVKLIVLSYVPLEIQYHKIFINIFSYFPYFSRLAWDNKNKTRARAYTHTHTHSARKIAPSISGSNSGTQKEKKIYIKICVEISRFEVIATFMFKK